MDVTTIIPRLPDRPAELAIAWTCDRGSIIGAAQVVSVASYRLSVEIFKKTPCAAGLSRAGRDVAQHTPKVDDIPCLTASMLGRDGLRGESLVMAKGATREISNGVMWKPCQDVLRSADKSVASMGDVVGLGGNPVAAIGGVGPTAKSIKKESATRTSKSAARATNHPSGSVWKDARQMVMRAGGAAAVTRQGLREAM
jgi:hypothetical protein